MKTMSLAFVASLLFLGSGCIVDPHHHDCIGAECGYGDISFDWQFRLNGGTITPYCADAYVSTIYYELYDVYDVRVDYGEVSCESPYKIVIYDIPVGSYILDVEGLSSTGAINFRSSYNVDVYYGSNDQGVLTLEYYP